MDILRYVIFAFVLAISFMQIVAPQVLWRASRWQYRNPAATEPSRAGYMVQRFVGVIVFVFAIVVIFSQIHK